MTHPIDEARRVRRRAKRPYPIQLEAISVLSNAQRWLEELHRNGTRHPHGVYPNTPLTPAMRRDVETIDRAIQRLYAADAKNRRS